LWRKISENFKSTSHKGKKTDESNYIKMTDLGLGCSSVGEHFQDLKVTYKVKFMGPYGLVVP
jgi:hypothetical protein